MVERIILIVEDDDVQRRQMARLLRAEGYKVSQASTGDEAVRTLGEVEVALVLTDRKMPIMDGISLLKYMSANHAKVPVAIVTAYPDGIEELEPDALLVKPFSGDQLKEVVRRLTERQTPDSPLHRRAR